MAKPLIISEQEWQGDNLEIKYLKEKFDEYGLEYAQQVNGIRRDWDNWHGRTDQDPLLQSLGNWCDVYPDYALDRVLLMMKLFVNTKWARAKGNKFLLSEDLDGFPSMNYTLREGPYFPPVDAKFGAEDFHVVLQGFHKNLIFLQPRIHGFEKGWYVESSL